MNEIDPIAQESLSNYNFARNQAVSGMESTPDEAARSIELSKVSGVPAPAILGDLPEFEAAHKRKLAGEIIAGNHHLVDYVNANPIHSRISSDDYGQLDAASAAVQKLNLPRMQLPSATAIIGSTMEGAIHGFKKGFGDGPIGSAFLKDDKDFEFASQNKLTAATAIALGSPVEAVLRGLSGAIEAVKEGAVGGAETAYKQFGGSESEAARFGREIGGFVEFATTDAPAMHSISKPNVDKAAEAIRAARPWLDSGREPPAGLHPEIDKLKVEQNDRDVKNLMEATKESQASATRTRDPDIYASFIRQHTDATIGVSAEAVQRLYGEKFPERTDNILGWAGIEDSYRTALATGGDVQIPLADWLAKVDPEIAKALEDDIRVRPGAITKNEHAIAQAFEVEAYHGSPHEFDAFLDEKIGTGEGAQQYGYGLYFAENPKVAEGYAKRLSQEIQSKGVKYRVKIDAEKEHFLYWDAPVEQQPENVKKVLVKKWALVRGISEQEAAKIIANMPSAGDVYKTLERYLTPKALAQEMQQEGIPGIRYLDSESRDYGEGTNNIVVFDPKSVQIVERNGKAIVDEAIAQTRAAASLEPMFSVGDRKLTLVPLDEPSVRQEAAAVAERVGGFEDSRYKPNTMKDYEIHNAEGKPVGYINMSLQKDGKQIYIENIEGVAGNWANDLGPAAVRDLMRQLKEQFPEATELTGHRVSGMRQQAGSVMTKGQPVVKFDATDMHQQFRDLTDWIDAGSGLEYKLLPSELYTKNDVELTRAVNEEIRRIAGKDVESVGTQGIKSSETDRAIRGVYRQFSDKNPAILWSLNSPDAIGTVRHEAIHHLYRQGFFKDAEWDTLRNAAESLGWMEKYKINERYGRLDEQAKLEEAIADAYKDWVNRGRAEAVFSKAVNKPLEQIFAKIKELIDAIGRRFKEILGREPTWDELFRNVDEGKVAERGRTQVPRTKGSFATELGDEAKERDLFAKASAVGMTQDQYRRYMKLIEKRNLEDVAAATKAAEAAQRKRQSSEWKSREAELRPEALADVNARPAVAVDDFFREGTLYGNKLDSMPKLGLDHLTREQEAAVPTKYVAKKGLNPDELAPLFGFKDGDAMIASMAKVEADRKSANVRPSEYKRLLVNLEVERRMQKEFGNLEENILEAAKEQALSETQLDILHEETVALAEKAKLQAPIAKGELKAAVQQEFANVPISGMLSDKFMQFAGKAGRMAEMALLKGDAAGAFKAKQQQYNAILYANEAKAFEKEFEKYEKVAKRFSKREIKGINQDATNFIQQLLQSAGESVRRTADDISTGIAHSGYENLDAFMSERISDGFDSAISPGLGKGQVKQIDQMNVAEFRAYNDAINNLVHIGREMEKIEIAGQKMEFAEWRQGVLDNITQLPARDKNKGPNWFYKFDAEHLRMEELVKDLDLRQELGPLFKAIVEPMVLSKAKEYGMMEALTKRLAEIRGFDKDWQKTLGDTIPQDFFVDPYDGVHFDMSREHMIQIMLNWGNRSNIEKFTKGYGSPELHRVATKEEAAAFEAKMKALIDKHATKQDWDYVQAIWDIFKDFQKEADTVYRNTSGVAPKWIETQAIETPHGTYNGGYYPIIYDKLRSNINVIRERQNDAGLFNSDYYRASTSKGYTNERTGYSDRIDFQSSIEQIGLRMQQVIHDISFRDSVMQAGKVISDKQIRAAIRKHYGQEYEAQLDPWLKRVANNFNQNEQAVSATNAMMRRARINLIGHALPLNLKVILSPSTGVMTPKSVASFYANLSENTKLAMEKSNEIPHTVFNIDRDYRESLERTISAKGWSGFQADAVRWGFGPISKIEQQTRMMTFTAEYKRALANGRTETEAATLADSKVRERHGSASVVDMPAIMQSSEAMKLMTMFYGFFSTMQNWQRQLVGNVRRGEWKEGLATFYGAVLIPSVVGALLFNQQKEGDSWFKTMGTAMLLTPLSNLVGVRDAANYFLQGQSPRSPLASVLTAVGQLGNDVKKYVAKKPIEKPIQHAANFAGMVGGVPGMAQIGRTSQFGYDVATNKQRPRNIQEWARGIITGEARLKK